MLIWKRTSDWVFLFLPFMLPSIRPKQFHLKRFLLSIFFLISRKKSYFHKYKFTITVQCCASNIIMGLLYLIRNDKHTRTFSLIISNSVPNASYFLISIHYWWSSKVLYIINDHFTVSWCQWILLDLLPIECDTIRVWGKSNLSNMMNEGWLDVYFLYFFFLFIWNK